MRGAVRLGDYSTGHGCWPAKPNIEASTDCFVNGRGQVRVGDAWAVHCCRSKCHGSVQAEGSPNIFVNNRPAARIGDSLSCTDIANSGSPDTFLN